MSAETRCEHDHATGLSKACPACLEERARFHRWTGFDEGVNAAVAHLSALAAARFLAFRDEDAHGLRELVREVAKLKKPWDPKAGKDPASP